MKFNEMYRVLVKKDGRFVGTGQTNAGEITIENKIIHQTFYPLENAEKLQGILEKDGWETKLEKGS